MNDRPNDPFAHHPSHVRERIRLEITLANIPATRSLGLVKSLEEEVKETGYLSAADFWDAVLARPMPDSHFKHLLESFRMSPSPNSPERKNFKLLIDHVLRLGFDTNQRWAVSHSDKKFVKPREAALWLLSMPSERGLLPEELIQYLKGTKQALGEPSSHVAEVESTSTAKANTVALSNHNVSESDLRAFLKTTATRQHTKPQLRKLATSKFPGHRIPDRLFEKAYQALSAEQKRGPGDHARTLERLNSAKG
jgi:hypothetical protein